MSINNFRSKTFRSTVLAGGLALCAAGISLFFPAEFFPAVAVAQGQQIVWSKQEKSILEDIRDLRNLSEGNRAKTTRQLALKIRQLPAGINKQRLAVTLASRSTEGDAGNSYSAFIPRRTGSPAKAMYSAPNPWLQLARYS